MENAKILVANTAMDTDKIKIYGARVKTDSMAKVGSLNESWGLGWFYRRDFWYGSLSLVH